MRYLCCSKASCLCCILDSISEMQNSEDSESQQEDPETTIKIIPSKRLVQINFSFNDS